jgi:glycine/D-amino acid oxidase-like deaminating enzyme
MHAVVVGAGIIGASVAFHLAEKGARVTVIDAAPPATMASGRSFGWINASFYLTDAHFHLRAEGMAAHRRLSARLPGCETLWPGCLWYEEQGEAQAMAAQRLQALGYRVDHRTRAQIADMVPALATPPDTALFLPDEGATDAALLTARLLAAPGITTLSGLPVTALHSHGGRITAAATPEGQIAADHVVLATGTSTPDLLEPLGIPLPMLHRPGLILRTRPVPPILPLILCSATQEVRQLPCGRLLTPAAANHQADSATGLADTLETLAHEGLARLQQMFPATPLALEHANIGHRPVPGDNLPAIGHPLPGLSVAVMHSGVTLAAITGELMAAEITGATDAPLLAPFRPARFA